MTAIAVIGLGKLGAPLAAVLASKGHDVVGIDLNEAAVRLVEAGRAPVEEPGLAELMSAHRERLRATTDLAVAAEADVSIILVPTPSDESGAFSNEHVLNVTEAVGAALAGRTDPHVVVVASTVMPGSCDGEIGPTLERASGRRIGESLGLCYSPEFIALGSVIRDMLEPDMVLIGESDPRAGEILEDVYKTVCENDPPFRRMSLLNAELTKIAVNTYVTMKISYANTLATIGERLPGADADVVTDALGLDSRIGPKYLRGATAYGGPCFPRDNKAFAAMARGLGVDPLLAEATDAVNRARIDELARLTQEQLADGGAVGVLGLSYKPGTGVADESAGIELARLLALAGYDVYAFDPEAAPQALHENVTLCTSLAELARCTDVVVITTPWPEFAALPQHAGQSPSRRLVAIDCWGVLPNGHEGTGVEIVRLGRQSVPSGVS